MNDYTVVSKPIEKKDAKALLSGRPVFADDIAPEEALIVKLMHSPHAFAKVREIDVSRALKVPGVECVLTYKDVPNIRFTQAGQTYPEPSPYDRLIIDQYVRHVGDIVAIVAAKDEKTANKAIRMIKVDYEILEPVLDYHTSKDNPILVHPEENWEAKGPIGIADNHRNLVGTEGFVNGDVDAVLASCVYTAEGTYHTVADNQAMMEPFVTVTNLDAYGRLVVTSATQIPFHVRRIVARALGISKSKVRVIKPRIGGGFGAKQTAVSEVYPAIVTWLTGKPAKIIFTRREVMTSSTSRHEMEVTVKIGADADGIIQAIDVYTISNTGAYSEHGPTTVGLSGHKPISMYGPLKASRFKADVVYTNTMSGGAFRGYGATQGIYAVESVMDDLAEKMGMDPIDLREKNIIKEGVPVDSYYGEVFHSVGLKECLQKVRKMSGWDEKTRFRDLGNGKVRAMGVALAMQGSGISGVDQAAAVLRLSDDGTYNLQIGAADMGTGCDTIMSQIAAEIMECDMNQIAVHSVDTDVSPYDSGSYASSTTYVTGNAVIKTAESLREKMIKKAAELMDAEDTVVLFDGKTFTAPQKDKALNLEELAKISQINQNEPLSAQASYSSPVSPPPFMAGIAEVDIDTATGQTEVVNYYAVIDCGTPINSNLVRIQAEGGLLQGIGMALYEDIQYGADGQMLNNSFMQYKIPSRIDFGHIMVDFAAHYEPTGPFGAKSIGEIVINTPSPAIGNAIKAGCGVRLRQLPMSAERLMMAMLKKQGEKR